MDSEFTLSWEEIVAIKAILDMDDTDGFIESVADSLVVRCNEALKPRDIVEG
jgi:hypothetical protein